MRRRAALFVLVFALAGCGGRDTSHDHTLADAYLRAVLKTCDQDTPPASCTPLEVSHLGGEVWVGRYRREGRKSVGCVLLQLDEFRPRPGGGDFYGAAPMICPKS